MIKKPSDTFAANSQSFDGTKDPLNTGHPQLQPSIYGNGSPSDGKSGPLTGVGHKKQESIDSIYKKMVTLSPLSLLAGNSKKASIQIGKQQQQQQQQQDQTIGDNNFCNPLPYFIQDYSSFSSQYHPSNIMTDNPTDQGSRWSSAANNQNQFLLLRLEDDTGVVTAIKFGKYHKQHVCNLKEFKVYGGMDPDNLTELCHGGLKNDSEPETLSLKFQSSNARVDADNAVLIPIRFIKIQPIMAWGQNFNFSIWHVQLLGVSSRHSIGGIDGSDLMRSICIRYDGTKEKEIVRMMLKFVRERGMDGVFNAIIQQAQSVQLEDPMLTLMHKFLVGDGNFHQAEEIVCSGNSELFNEYIALQPYKPEWKRLDVYDQNGEKPGMRGGHQMCMDIENRVLYLLGGWNGTKDLADFWAYHLPQSGQKSNARMSDSNVSTANDDGHWERISADTSLDGGPGARSCHKIAFDQESGMIYVFGKYVDLQSRPEANMQADFYCFNVHTRKWKLISGNTLLKGGPDLIYDHQMCIDPVKKMMYIFGGKSLNASTATEGKYSGLYQYDIKHDRWKLLLPDAQQNQGEDAISQVPSTASLKSRIGHSMLLDHQDRKLYIFAGQRMKDYLGDFYVYDIDSGALVELTREASKQGGPDCGFTQRATLNIMQKELYVFSGLMREKNSNQDTVKNTLWMYNITQNKWSRISNDDATAMAEGKEPSPRFAHQLIYDDLTGDQYLFGGNPGASDVTGQPQNVRLDDFWLLKLKRPSYGEILQRCRFMLRRQQFKEMCASADSMQALRYLQSELSAVVDHSNSEQSVEFRNLASSLLNAPSTQAELFKQRTALYEEILKYFPERMKQPKRNLTDLIEF
ncbi:hypothetical protein MP228_003311 [Amoeboaphelidium protococcarum]|nr:hypothetical protein MP228_003311 [Amoeboaphelidium protococcarum]